MRKSKGLLRLIRFELPFSAGVCVVLGQLLALGKFPSAMSVLCGFLSVFCISASILVLNDYFDYETDKINAPDRPLPSGVVTPKETVLFAAGLLLSGLLLGGLLNMMSIIAALFLFLIGYLYNSRFKRTGLPGNIMVAVSVGMTFVYGGISIGQPLNKTVLLFAAISGLIDLGEEIAADANDVEGDKLIDSNSIAIRYGEKAALRISGIVFFFAVLLTCIPILGSWFTLPNLFPFLLMDCAIIFCTIRIQKVSRQDRRKYLRVLYLSGTLGVILFIILKALGKTY